MANPLIPSKAPDYPTNQMITNDFEIDHVNMEEMFCPIDLEDSPNSVRRKGAVKSTCKTTYNTEKNVVKTMKELMLEAENKNKLSPRENYNNNITMFCPRETWEKALRKSMTISQDAMLATVKIFDANSLLPPPSGVYCVAKYRYKTICFNLKHTL